MSDDNPRNLPARIPQPEPPPAPDLPVLGEGQHPPMSTWGAETRVVEPMRPRTAYLDEAPNMVEPDQPKASLPTADTTMKWGPYRGWRFEDIPTEHLMEQRMFANGAPPEVEAELRRRGA